MTGSATAEITDSRTTDIAQRVTAVRGQMTRAEFAKVLGVSQMAISRWETGKNVPSPAAYLKLARLAEGDARAWFARQAGSEVTELALEVLGTHESSGHHRLVTMPLISATAGAGTAHLHDREDIEGEMAVPRDLCRAPAHTACVRVRGSSMEPTIQDGTIAAVDESQKEPGRLVNKVVAAFHEVDGMVIKRLAKINGAYTLLSDQPGNRPLHMDHGWRLVGRVIWWIHKEERR